MRNPFFKPALFLAAAMLFFSFPAVAQPMTPEKPSGPSAPLTDQKEAQKDKKAENAGKPSDKAAEKEPAPPMTPEQQARDKEAKQILEAWKKIADKLNREDLRHFYYIYSNYNIIGTVKVVMDDVGNAIKACGEKNPHLKDDLQKNYKDWRGAIDPVLSDAEANLNNMVLAQEYTEPAEIKKVFKAVDNVRKNTAEMYVKTPVTTEEACKFLEGKMNDTQESLLSYLRGTLVSYGHSYPEKDAVKVPNTGTEKKEEPKKDSPAPEQKPAETKAP